VNSADGRIGVIAGSGHLPLHVAHCLADGGKDVYVAGLKGAADPALDDLEWDTEWYDIYSLQGLLDGLERAGVRQVVLAGQVPHDEIFRTAQFDDLLLHFLKDLKDQRPATILGGLVDLLTVKGFEVFPLTKVAPDLLPASGHLAGPPVQPHQIQDLELGWRIARVIADQDIGQTAIVKGGAVVAVEAMEGTDRAIDRAGAISGGGFTLVKLAAVHHDFRYDVPTIGPDTVVRFDEAGGGVIAIEAGRSFMLDFHKISALCDEKGITLLSGSETEDGRVHWPEA
jgi:DUF1009 family protein